LAITISRSTAMIVPPWHLTRAVVGPHYAHQRHELASLQALQRIGRLHNIVRSRDEYSGDHLLARNLRCRSGSPGV